MESAAQLHLRRESQKSTLDSYRSKYIDSSTGLLSQSFSTLRSCPVCEDASLETELFVKNGCRHVYCRGCKFIFVKNILTPEHQYNYYKYLPHLQGVFAQKESDFYTSIYSKGLHSVLRCLGHYEKEKLRLLDIGCSTGLFLDVAKSYGLPRVAGVEINKQDSAHSVSKGHTVYESLLLAKKPYDIITLWDVFEHIENPFEFLSEIKSFLTPNGILFMQIPTCDALAARIMRSECNMFDGIEHLNLYSSNALNLIADKARMKLLSVESVIDEFFPISNYLSYSNPYTPMEEALLQIGSLLTPSQIISAGLGYKMQALFRPK